MPKTSTRYVCQACGYQSPRWVGRCPECGAFSTFSEEKIVAPSKSSGAARRESSGATWSNPPAPLSAVEATPSARLETGMAELDRVLGGGIVPGSLVLIGGDPGIGKSTLLIEAAVRLARRYSSGLYVSGEESTSQVGLRARRLQLESDDLLIAAETDLAAIESYIREKRPAVAVVDSVQTMAHPDLDSAPGTLSQVREAATTLQRVAKETNVPILLVGHVTKEGNLAGPRALEHIVDAVLQLEGESHHAFRILRAVKNRFGSTNELGVFEMTEGGMLSVDNPSQLFLSQRMEDGSHAAPGSAVAAVVEGARPILVEVQALCAPSYFAAPRRVVTGADYNRVLVVLAVIEKRLQMRLGDMDVYINVAGGVRVSEPALDLAIALAIVSSLSDQGLPKTLCAFGEIGLAGEVRGVAHADRRVAEAARLGFASCSLPRNGLDRLGRSSMELHGAATLRDAVEFALPGAIEAGGRSRQRRAEFNGRGAGQNGKYAASPARRPSPDLGAHSELEDFEPEY